jgi:hypothetical protein
MPLTAEQLEGQVASSLAIADDFKAKGDVRWELTNVSSALDLLLTMAVTHRTTADEGIAYLHAQRCGDLLERYHALNSRLLQGFLEGTSRAAVDNDVTTAHLAWLLGKRALGDLILAVVLDARIAKLWPHTKFWAEYHRAMAALVERHAYEPQLPKLKGYEKCWAPYLDLVAALTGGRDGAPELAACAASFARRNRDKRLTDWKMHDGDGHVPVQWDFRVPSILTRWQGDLPGPG